MLKLSEIIESLEILLYVCIMELQEAKDKFIQSWGTLGNSWGVNRTMAQIHALLLVSPEALSAEDVMEQLHISRGNANMNLRALMDWGIVEKELKRGERKEFFVAPKDIWELGRQVTRERQRREVEPVLKVLAELQKVKGNSKEVKDFKKVMGDVSSFTEKVSNILDKFIKSDEHWFYKSVMKLLK